MPDVDMDKLAEWCEKMYPRIKEHLNANVEQRAFDNYEVHWDEERGEIKELHLLYTNFNFIEANEAVQKTLNLMQQNDDTGVSSRAADSGARTIFYNNTP